MKYDKYKEITVCKFIFLLLILKLLTCNVYSEDISSVNLAAC
jgi:hypothetical protein